MRRGGGEKGARQTHALPQKGCFARGPHSVAERLVGPAAPHGWSKWSRCVPSAASSSSSSRLRGSAQREARALLRRVTCHLFPFLQNEMQTPILSRGLVEARICRGSHFAPLGVRTQRMEIYFNQNHPHRSTLHADSPGLILKHAVEDRVVYINERRDIFPRHCPEPVNVTVCARG